MSSSSKQQHSIIPPSLAWLTVFIPAVAYFLGSRLQDTRFSGRAMGTLVQHQLQLEEEESDAIASIDKIKSIFYIDSSTTSSTTTTSTTTTLLLKQGLNLVQSAGLDHIVDTIWNHDAELGRGFLLLSQAANHGRIWRWEVGGGPIAIGKTLHMEPSGCRSKSRHCDSSSSSPSNKGSGALALDFGSQPTNQEGRLVVSEWGEERIVRMEQSGARTPLLIQLPSLCSAGEKRRIYQPNALLYTTFGDLIVADYDVHCQQAGLYYLKKAMTIAPLENALESRKAHSWTTTHNHNLPVKVLLDDNKNLTAIGGLALDSTWTGLYVMVQLGQDKIQLLHLFLNGDDDDDEPLWNGKSKVIYEWKQSSVTNPPGPVVVDQKGNLYVGVNEQLVVLSSSTEGNNKIMAHMDLPARATSLTLGQDGFLYVSSSSDLYRIQVRKNSQPLKVPTNLWK